jgi:hypothetical protein
LLQDGDDGAVIIAIERHFSLSRRTYRSGA